MHGLLGLPDPWIKWVWATVALNFCPELPVQRTQHWAIHLIVKCLYDTLLGTRHLWCSLFGQVLPFLHINDALVWGGSR